MREQIELRQSVLSPLVSCLLLVLGMAYVVTHRPMTLTAKILSLVSCVVVLVGGILIALLRRKPAFTFSGSGLIVRYVDHDPIPWHLVSGAIAVVHNKRPAVRLELKPAYQRPVRMHLFSGSVDRHGPSDRPLEIDVPCIGLNATVEEIVSLIDRFKDSSPEERARSIISFPPRQRPLW